MAPDIDDAEALISQMRGIENSWTGRILVRLVRVARAATTSQAAIRTRVDELEQRVVALEDQPPQ